MAAAAAALNGAAALCHLRLIVAAQKGLRSGRGQHSSGGGGGGCREADGRQVRVAR